MKIATLIFKFFASLRLAIFLLLALAFILAVGTLMESAYGTEAAKLVVYRSFWMSLFLILLALNVAAAALDRLPWKKKHTGFVITHAGILLILAGALVTRAYAIEGQMAIEEGKTVSRMILNESRLQLFSETDGPLDALAIPPQAFPWQGRKQLHENPNVWLLRYLPKASRHEKIREASEGPAALRVSLSSSFMKVEHELLVDDPERSRVFLGPATLQFSRNPIHLEQASPENAGELEFQFDPSSGRPASLKVKIPEPTNPDEKVSLPGTPYQIRILRVLREAVVEGGKLLDQSKENTYFR